MKNEFNDVWDEVIINAFNENKNCFVTAYKTHTHSLYYLCARIVKTIIIY